MRDGAWAWLPSVLQGHGDAGGMGLLPRSPTRLVPMDVLHFESELLSVLLFGFSLSFLLVLTEANSSVIKTFRSVTLPVKFSSVSFLLLRLLAGMYEE